MPKSKRAQLDGHGPVGETAVVGVKDRATNQVQAKVVEDTTAETLQGFVLNNIAGGYSSIHRRGPRIRRTAEPGSSCSLPP